MRYILTGFFLFQFTLAVQSQSGAGTNNHHTSIHAFDFWLGEWEVYKFGTDTLVGYSKIESIIDSMGILEDYTNFSGKYKGKSLNKFNINSGLWEQYWIDNAGYTLHLSGGLHDNSMVMSDSKFAVSNEDINQITWTPMPGDRVRQTWSLINKSGTSILFDGEYIKKQ